MKWDLWDFSLGWKRHFALLVMEFENELHLPTGCGKFDLIIPIPTVCLFNDLSGFFFCTRRSHTDMEYIMMYNSHLLCGGNEEHFTNTYVASTLGWLWVFVLRLDVIITGLHGPATSSPRLVNRLISPCIRAYIRNIPLEVLHDTLHGHGPPHSSGDNVHSCISLCSPINYPCRQHRCRICIQV